jgi:hypothetical protein
MAKTANWIDQLPTVEECDKEIAKLEYWLDTERYEMTAREAVELADRIRSWKKKRYWANRHGKVGY